MGLPAATPFAHMHILKAAAEQLPLILPVYEQARRFMVRNGNAGQWTNGYPSAELLRGDIARGHLYICLDGEDIAAVCIRTSTERPEAMAKGAFILAGIAKEQILQAVETAVKMRERGDFGETVPDYACNVSDKVVKIIQSYTGIVNKMVWRK